MDMTVAGIDSESGMTFKREQSNTNVSAGAWAFFGWFNAHHSHSEVNVATQTQQEAMWASGQVRLDATLGSRRAEKLPVGADFAIGPQIYFSQGAVREEKQGTLMRRSIDVTIQVRKASGAVNASAALVVSCDTLSLSFASGYSSLTNAQGQTRITLSREYPVGFAPGSAKAKVTVKLGDYSRDLDVSL
jgi:hypothetical protein